MKFLKHFNVGLLAALMVGCGGEESATSTPSPTVLPPKVHDNYSQVILSDQNKVVSLAHNVIDPQGLPVTLESVTSLSEECTDPTVDSAALTFTIDKHVPDTCYYSYTVKNKADDAQQSKSASANSFVLVSETRTSSLLIPISETAAVGDTLTIDLEQELGGQIPEGYLLDDDVLVLGDGKAYVSPDSENTIIYEATAKGSTRLLYSLSSDDGQNLLAGWIDVAVSGPSTGAPIANNFVGPQDVEIGTTVGIDVISHISDPDGDDLQLIDVYAFNADVAVIDGSKTEFSFSANQAGTYHVNYVITDHLGGYASAMVSVLVIEDEPPLIPWDDIILSDGEVYTAPYDQQGAEANGWIYQDLQTEVIVGQEFQIPLFNHDSAQSLCSGEGWRLPTQAQLTKLHNARGSVSTSDDWPVVSAYWTNESDTAVNLQTGSILSSEDPFTPHIVTCVYQGQLSAEVIKDYAYAMDGTEPDDFDTVEAKVMSPSGDPVANADVYLYTTESELLLSGSHQQTDANGSVTFNIFSQEPGSFKVMVNYLSQTVEQTINFIANLLNIITISGEQTVELQESIQLDAFATYDKGNQEDITAQAQWSSSDSTHATVNGGLVVGEGLGTTTITAAKDSVTSDGHTVTVVDGWGDGELTVTPSSVDMHPGEETTLRAVASTKAEPSGKDVTASASWSSLSPGIATVEEGVVSAISSGTTTVRASYLVNGVQKTDDALVQVTEEVTIQDVYVTPDRAAMGIDETIQLAAYARYSDGSEANVTTSAAWESDDALVASVGNASEGGKVTANASGSAQVHAEFQGLTASSAITVTQNGGEIEIENAVYTLGLSQRKLITAIVHTGEDTAVVDLFDIPPVILAGDAQISEQDGKYYIHTSNTNEQSIKVEVSWGGATGTNTYNVTGVEVGGAVFAIGENGATRPAQADCQNILNRAYVVFDSESAKAVWVDGAGDTPGGRCYRGGYISEDPVADGIVSSLIGTGSTVYPAQPSDWIWDVSEIDASTNTPETVTITYYETGTCIAPGVGHLKHLVTDIDQPTFGESIETTFICK